MCVVTEFLPRENSQYLGKIIRFLGESSTFSHISYRLHSLATFRRSAFNVQSPC
ncbi:hypothetical protein M404DRAFT_712453 [Pisolithus tinctorius Marx 270]|uniref:Uncharacterized protein n=1 Tax=Pisolithus tinctorius Marx 270 TaxID=870435 RepID=A0A0C3NMG1_PISTI|nr:hypothetical protein M404DRAFT_712453 [Pisolithus tinctorius Marx 270]